MLPRITKQDIEEALAISDRRSNCFGFASAGIKLLRNFASTLQPGNITGSRFLELISILQWQDNTFFQQTKLIFTPLQNKICKKWPKILANYNVLPFEKYIIDVEFLLADQDNEAIHRVVDALNELNDYFSKADDIISGAPLQLRKLLFSYPRRAKNISQIFFSLIGFGIPILSAVKLIEENIGHLPELLFSAKYIYYFFCSTETIIYREFLLDTLINDKTWFPHFKQFVRYFKNGLLHQDRYSSFYDGIEVTQTSSDYDLLLLTIKDNMEYAIDLANAFEKASRLSLRSDKHPKELSPIIDLICAYPQHSQYILNIITCLTKYKIKLNYFILHKYGEFLNEDAENIFKLVALHSLLNQENFDLMLPAIKYAHKIIRKFEALYYKDQDGFESIIKLVQRPANSVFFIDNLKPTTKKNTHFSINNIR